MYKNPIPVAVNVVRVEDESGIVGLLGIIRGIEPAIGGLVFPGGYVDEMESVEMAAARELFEETGLSTKPSEWRIMESAITGSNRVLIFCELMRAIDIEMLERLTSSEEVQGFAIIKADTELAFPLHQTVAHKYLNSQG